MLSDLSTSVLVAFFKVNLYLIWKITFRISGTCFVRGRYPSSYLINSVKALRTIQNKGRHLGETNLTWKIAFKVDALHWRCCLLRECGYVVVYSNAAQEHLNTILYTGFVEELVDILELKDANLTVSFCNLSFFRMGWHVAFPSQFEFCVSSSISSIGTVTGIVCLAGHKSNSIENACGYCTSGQKSQVWYCYNLCVNFTFC